MLATAYSCDRQGPVVYLAVEVLQESKQIWPSCNIVQGTIDDVAKSRTIWDYF